MPYRTHDSSPSQGAIIEGGVHPRETAHDQRCRERFGRDAVLTGFGTHTGTVAAASDMNVTIGIWVVLPLREDSDEYRFDQSGQARCFGALSTHGPRELREREQNSPGSRDLSA
jgi:erythromycin esterase-like protein